MIRRQLGVQRQRKRMAAEETEQHIGKLETSKAEVEQYLVDLEASRGETQEYIGELGEQRAKIKGYESEGYEVTKDAEGKLQFTKKTYTPGERKIVGYRKQSIRVHWRHNVTGATGSFLGHNTSLDTARRQLAASNRSITKITTIGGGEPIYKETEGYWTTEDKVLWEAQPVQMVETKTVSVPFSDVKLNEYISKTTPKPETYWGQTPSVYSTPGTTMNPMEQFQQTKIYKDMSLQDKSKVYEDYNPVVTSVDIAAKRTEWTIKGEGVTDQTDIQSIFKSELRKQDYDIVTIEGEPVIIKGSSVDYDKMMKEQDAIRKRMTGTPAERITEFGRFWATSVLSAPSFYPRMAGAIAGGKRKDVLNVYSRSMQPYERARKTKSLLDIPMVAATSYTEPGGLGRLSLEVAATSYLMGAGVGALKKTSLGSKTVLESSGVWSNAKHGKIFTRLFKPKAGEPIWKLTVGRAAETGIAGYYSKDIPGSLKEKPWETLTSMAITLPFVGGAYKAGHSYGSGLVDRLHGMSKVTGLNRIRQQGLYETFDVIDEVKTPKYKTKPYDLTNVERINRRSALKVTEFIKSEYGKRSRPSIGGSLSLDIMGIPRRKMPRALGDWALRQSRKAKTFVGEKKLRSPFAPSKDVDIMLRDVLNVGRDELGYLGLQSSLERAKSIGKPHVIDIWKGGYKPGRELGFGLREMRRVKGQIYDPWFSRVSIKPEKIEYGVSGYTYDVPSKGRGMKLTPEQVKAMEGFGIKDARFDIPDIRISSEYLKYTGKKGYWTPPPTRGTSYGIPAEVSAKRIIMHELGHHEFPLTSAGRGRISTGIVERLNVVLEHKVFRDPKMMSAVDVFIETGKWTYPGKKMNVLVLNPLEQFGRTGEAILPSNVELKGYRVAKDVQRWWNIGKAIIDKNKHAAKKLTRSMDKVVHPELYKSEIPRVSFGERLVKRMGGKVKPVDYGVDVGTGSYYPIYPSSVYPSMIQPYGIPSYPSRKGYPASTPTGYSYPSRFKKPNIIPPITYKPPVYNPGRPPVEIILPTTPPPDKPYEYVPDEIPPPPPPYTPKSGKTYTPIPPPIIYGKDFTVPPPPSFKFDKPVVKKPKKKRYDDSISRRKKTLKGLPKIERPRYKFRKFDIGDLFKGSKVL